jgi:hypothetical protein
MDLAQPVRRNKKEIRSHSPLPAAESVLERDRDRRHIVILLSDANDERQHGYTGPLSERERDKYCFRKSGDEMAITLYGPIRTYSVPYMSKTVAILHRGDPFAWVSAISGWGADALPLDDRTRPPWSEQVQHIASTIGHKLPDKGHCDQGIPGRYFACHAEKKLIAYFIDKHVFMPQARRPDRELEDSIEDANDSILEQQFFSIGWNRACVLERKKVELNRQLLSADDQLLGDSPDEQKVTRLENEIHTIDEELSSLHSDAEVAAIRAQEKTKARLLKREKRHERLMELSRNEPPLSLKRAVILSSNEICQDCERFRKRVNDCFDLNIEISRCV